MTGPVLFLGETLVDLICERPLESWSRADSFVPHCGGAPTNAAIVAARCGAAAALAGGVGDDQWGRWLEDRLRAENLDLRWWRRLGAVQTGVAFDVIDPLGVPDFLIYGEGIEPALEALAPEVEAAVSAACAVELGSNTLIGARGRELSFRARELALATGKPLLVDVNLRLGRWESPVQAVDAVLSLCAGAFLVKVNREEAQLLSGEIDPARAAETLCSRLGARAVVVTLGAGGALVRGETESNAAGVPAAVMDTTGAGDVLLGIVAAALAASGFDPGTVASILSFAVATAAKSTERFGALDAVPKTIRLPLR